MGAYKYYNPSTGTWEIIKSKSIIKPDGSLEYTPDDIKGIDDKINNLSTDVDEHKADKVAHIDYAVASGTNTYTANIQGITALVEGLSVKIKFQNVNTGASTLNINGLGAKEIQKSNGNALSSGNIKAGQICHLVYTGSNFQLLGEGGEYGTAQAGDVLSGKTIGTESGIITGIMPNNGAINNIITTQNGQIAIPQGYHNGSGIVKAQFANLTSSNIKDGVNIGGVVGNYNGNFESTHRTLESVSSDYGTLCSENFSFHPTILIIKIAESITKEWQQYLVFPDSLPPWANIQYLPREDADVVISNIVVSDNRLTYYAGHDFVNKRDLIIDILAIGY